MENTGNSVFETLVVRDTPRVYRLALLLTGNQRDAEDVLQQTFLKAYPHFNGFLDKLSAQSWLMRIAASESLLRTSAGKSEKPAQTGEAIESDECLAPGEVVGWDDNPEQLYTKAELQRIADEALGALEPPLLRVVALRDIAKLSVPDITQLLNLSTPNVKGRLLRGRLKLRAHMNKYFRQGQDAGSFKRPRISKTRTQDRHGEGE